jgi:hypothetical protein
LTDRSTTETKTKNEAEKTQEQRRLLLSHFVRRAYITQGSQTTLKLLFRLENISEAITLSIIHQRNMGNFSKMKVFFLLAVVYITGVCCKLSFFREVKKRVVPVISFADDNHGNDFNTADDANNNNNADDQNQQSNYWRDQRTKKFVDPMESLLSLDAEGIALVSLTLISVYCCVVKPIPEEPWSIYIYNI